MKKVLCSILLQMKILSLITRKMEIEDNVIPASNSIMAKTYLN